MASCKWLLGKWSFTNYVEKTREGVFSTGNVNDMQILPYFSKGIPSQMSTRVGYLGRWSIMDKILSTWFVNGP